MEARYEIARKIVAMKDAYELGQLKRTARDYISGMLAAYGILIGTTDAEVALALAKVDALRTEDEDPVKFDEVSDELWQETLAGN